MISKINLAFSLQKKRHIILTMKALVFLCFTATYGVTPKKIMTSENVSTILQQTISGIVTDDIGEPIPGVNIMEKGTFKGVETNYDGSYTISLSNPNAILIFSFVGFKTLEIAVANQNEINVILEEEMSFLNEIVVIGYGVQKKVNLTAAVSVVGEEVFENRPTANAVRSLQGTVPGLQITNSSLGGEPGADSNINIRGFVTAGGVGGVEEASPLVLVDGIRMNINDINPEDIESVSVLKDAAAAAIYGSNAAAGAILVTTKSGKNTDGKARVNFRSNVSITRPTRYPSSASPINFAYTINDARTNNLQGAYYDETGLANIIANMANPGSAPSISSNAAGTAWDYGTIGIEGTGATNWDDIILKEWAQRTKHDLSVAGGTEKVNYYFSLGAYDEGGLLAVGGESFQRYNLDAKVSAKVNDWLTVELYSKFLKSFSDFPTETLDDTQIRNKTRVFDLITKIKPTLPQFDPIYGEELLRHSYYPAWEFQRIKTENDQLILAPKFILQPTKNLKLNVDLNYRRDNNFQEIIILANQEVVPNGIVDRISQEESSYSPTLSTTEYFSPNIYATYDKSINNHNFNATVGFQSELNNFYSLGATTDYLITNNIVSLNASLDEDQLASEFITNWSTLGYFGRFRYDFKEKYLLEFTYRRDGASRFSPENRWVGLPSFSAGYNIAKEDFWSIGSINTFKLRASYGSLGNQNVDNYLYLSLIDISSPGTDYLFDGEQGIFAQTPGLTSENLTWETVKTTDIGVDIGAFNNKLNVSFSWYRTDVEGMAGQGFDLPAQLGTDAPLTNVGTSRVQGWEIEANWRQQLGDFGYSIRGVLSDYKRTITDYPNDTNLLSNFYVGQDLGEIYGYETDGLFQSDEEAASYTDLVDQSFINGFDYTAGDLKYVDQNGDGEINNGNNTLGDSGDRIVIGNSTPRYQFAFNLGLNYKNWDLSAFIQGVGKREIQTRGQGFRGPSNGPFHAFVWEEHLDYFRPEDTTNPLGPNLNAFFPKPYLNGTGRTNKNYSQNTSHFMQNAAYTRLKSLQLGYTIPKKVTDDLNINTVRIYATGENLFTFTDLIFQDPETVTAGTDLIGSAFSYPLSTIISFGVNVSF